LLNLLFRITVPITDCSYLVQPQDLSSGGFALKGGRLDYLNQRSAASIVYQIRSHAINLFIFPSNEEDLDTPLIFQNKGYNIIKWVSNGLEYCAISDLNLSELELFAQLYRKENA
jgi:anti-sigma factor RsiW